MPFELWEILGSLNPTSGEIAAAIWAISKIPKPILHAFIASLNEQMVEKLARWCETFIKHMNDLGTASISPDDLRKSLEFTPDSDFMSVMMQTKFVGPKLSMEVVDHASNMITKAIKANNWQEAVWTGISLARMLPV